MIKNDDGTFYEELTDSISKLGINCSELHRYLTEHTENDDKISYGKFKRMIDEGKGLSETEKEIIQEYVHSKRYYKGYEHIRADRFCKLFNDLFNEFGCNQDRFEEESGINQSKVSRAMNLKNPYNLSVHEQYVILMLFLKKCQRENDSVMFDPANVYEVHYKRAKELYRILNGNTYIFDSYMNLQGKYQYSDRNILDILIDDYILDLKKDDQETILELPFAFFDTLLNAQFVDDWVIYDNQLELIEFFRSLPDDKRESFQYDLERLCFESDLFTYSDGFMFDIVTQKRKMIIKAREKGIDDPSGIIKRSAYPFLNYPNLGAEKSNAVSNTQYDPDKQRKRFEQFILDFIQFDIKEYPAHEGQSLIDRIIDGITYRLKMSPFEWHLDMLNSLCNSNNLGDEVHRLIEITKRQ